MSKTQLTLKPPDVDVSKAILKRGLIKTMNRFPEAQPNSKIRRSRDVTALSRLALLLFSGVILASGFVFAAKQHFAAVQYGYQNESLKNERRKLIEDNQRLALEREKVSSPAKLEMAARQLGLKPATPSQITSLDGPKSETNDVVPEDSTTSKNAR